MVKTVNKNVDEVLFGQLKGIDFEYLVQLNGLISDYIDEFGADVLDTELITFDITLNAVVKSRCEELIHAEERVKEIIAESREEKAKVKYVKEAREYLESLEDKLEGKTVDSLCLEIIERLKKHIYESGSLETQVDVLKTLLSTDIEDNETRERAIIASHLAMCEVVREVQQEELDKNREYINATAIDEFDKNIEEFLDGYELNGNWDFCAWCCAGKLGTKHLDEVFIAEFIENDKMHIVFQYDDFDLCEPYCLD
ncbi:hypothetical protein CLOBY_17960 [Clostridium saccharobutylicum]|uniref:hypothetical protein n=1 Tax=Clostridium saccharobutylicum TaxID=169679 RepID=UPI000983E362|nr:hypothetical protein [Clostridium saccharobutylicum]AQS09665.1 hypothetical protein CLOBY_17960 [Clostridium saccharobutylicum]MBC2436940.1 hypothetical protein [Clostridium saccharobutylicum]NSB89291.1 hypothetical protein [Clostridium saccharobutylicum]NYC27945.1 hypothetical protein [Clostridium saccharobutylicum]OOM17140.1 hypothetical protein CLSAB_20880 [Clostridium saccharobutylicum]